MLVLDDVVSEIDKELREARPELRRVTMEWKMIDAKELREKDAAGVDATGKRHLGPEALRERSVEGSGTEGICGYAGMRVLQAE